MTEDTMKIATDEFDWEEVMVTKDENMYIEGDEDYVPPDQAYVRREEAEDRIRELQEKIAVLERTGGAVSVSASKKQLSSIEPKLQELGYSVTLCAHGGLTVSKMGKQASAWSLDELAGVLKGLKLATDLGDAA